MAGLGTFVPVIPAGRNFTVPNKSGGSLGVVQKEERVSVRFNVSGSMKEASNKYSVLNQT